MRRKIKKLRKLNKLSRNKSNKIFSNSRNTPKNLRKVLLVGVISAILLVVIGIISFSDEKVIYIFSGKAYLNSLGVNTDSKYEDSMLETYRLQDFEGVVLGKSELNGEKRYIFCVNKDGVLSYDTEITEAQGEVILSNEYLNNGKVAVYNRTYKNNEGKKIKTYYYKIYCDASQVKEISI